MSAQNASVSARVLLAYALPGLVLAIPTLPVALYLPSLYGAEIGVAAVGAALLIARAADVFTDPLVGILSDRFPTRWGRRKPWIAAGALIGGISLVQLFQPPVDVGFSYLTVWSLFLYLGWTLISVPYSAWGAEMSGDYHQRTRITSAREAATLLGMLLASAWPAIAVSFGQSEGEAIRLLSWLAVALGTVFVGWLLIGVPDPLPRARPMSDSVSGGQLRRAIDGLRENRAFTRLVSAWFVNGLANGIPSALFLLFLEHRLQADAAQRSGLILLYFAAAVIGIPLWVALCRRYDKHRVWCAAMALTCAAFVCVPLLAPGDLVLFACICAVTGFGLGADLAIPPALQADVVDVDVVRTGQNRAGLYFSLWGMATKLALALGIGLAFPALALFGFDARGGNSARALLALAVIYAIVPVFMKIVAIGIVWRFPLTKEEHDALRSTIAARGDDLQAPTV